MIVKLAFLLMGAYVVTAQFQMWFMTVDVAMDHLMYWLELASTNESPSRL